MKLVKSSALALALMASLNVQAGLIQNGDFETGDFTGWQTDVDFGDFGGNDFSIDTNGGNSRAAIKIDSFSTAGDIFSIPLTDGFTVNTLSQGLDLSAALGSSFQLNLEIAGTTEATSSEAAETYLIGLKNDDGNFYGADGTLGNFLAEGSIDSIFSNALSFDLASSFTNATGWTLEIQLFTGVDDFSFFNDGFASTLYVDNVSLTEIQAKSVPESSIFALFALGLIGLIRSKKNH